MAGIDTGGDFGEEAGEGGFLVGGELTEDEVDVAEFLADFGIVSAEAKARKIGRFKVFRDGFETVIAAATAAFAEAEGAEIKVEIVAEDENIARGEFIKTEEIGDGETGFVVKSLGFEEDFIAGFEPEGAHFGLFPGQIMSFGIKI